jgi:hypothetical protein
LREFDPVDEEGHIGIGIVAHTLEGRESADVFFMPGRLSRKSSKLLKS